MQDGVEKTLYGIKKAMQRTAWLLVSCKAYLRKLRLLRLNFLTKCFEHAVMRL